MTSPQRPVLAWVLLLPAIACGIDLQDPAGLVEGGGEKGEGYEPPAEIPPEVEAFLADLLVCSEHFRPSTVERMREVLRSPDEQTLLALATAPEIVGDVVAAAGTEVEAAVLLYRNAALILEAGHAASAARGEWEALGCDDAITVACTVGTGTSRVGCDEAGAPSSVELSFEGCILKGTQLDGVAQLSREVEGARLLLGGLTLDEVKRLDGAVGVREEAGSFALAVDAGEPLVLTEFEGPEAYSCGVRTSFDPFALTLSDEGGTLALDAAREERDGAQRLRTVDAPLTFETEHACGCPLPGSGLEVELERPLPLSEGDALLRLRWDAPSHAERCAHTTVEVLEWPIGCGDVSDCGRDAAAHAIASLLDAFCASLAWSDG